MGPDIKVFHFEKPFAGRLAILVPTLKIKQDEHYGDKDFIFNFNSTLELSKYEYGYTFKLAILGFGFELWIGSNI
jgi:hypothetical protein